MTDNNKKFTQGQFVDAALLEFLNTKVKTDLKVKGVDTKKNREILEDIKGNSVASAQLIDMTEKLFNVLSSHLDETGKFVKITTKNYKSLINNLNKELSKKKTGKFFKNENTRASRINTYLKNFQEAADTYKKMVEAQKRVDREERAQIRQAELAARRAERDAQREAARIERARLREEARTARQAAQEAAREQRRRQREEQAEQRELAKKAAEAERKKVAEEKVKQTEARKARAESFKSGLMQYSNVQGESLSFFLENSKEFQQEQNQIISEGLKSDLTEEDYENSKNRIRGAIKGYKKRGIKSLYGPFSQMPSEMKTNFYNLPNGYLGNAASVTRERDGNYLVDVSRDARGRTIGGKRIGRLTSMYAGVDPSANPLTQSEMIRHLQEEATMGKVPANGGKANADTSFKSQERKNYDKQKQKGFLALLIPALQKLLNKTPLLDALKYLFLLLGKRHPVAAALGLTAGIPVAGGLLANKFLGNPLGFKFSGFFGGKPSANVFDITGKHIQRSFRETFRNLPKAFKGTPEAFKSFNLRALFGNMGDAFKGIWGLDVAKGGAGFTKYSRNASRVVGATKSAMKRGGILGALMATAFEIPNLIRANKEGRLGRQLASSGLNITGSLGGALLGGKAGGALGGALGSLFGPVGTAFGAAAGAIIGSIAGGIFGEKFAKKLDNGLDKLLQCFKRIGVWFQNHFPWAFGNKEQKQIAREQAELGSTKSSVLPNPSIVNGASPAAISSAQTANRERRYISYLEDPNSRSAKKLRENLAKQFKKENGRDATDNELANLYDKELQKHKDMLKRVETPEVTEYYRKEQELKLKQEGAAAKNSLKADGNGNRVFSTDGYDPSTNKFLGYAFSNNYAQSRRNGAYHHKGIDVATPMGSQLRAPVSGKITNIGYEQGGYGRYVDLTDNNGVTYRFAHGAMNQNLKKGQKIDKGSIFFTSGNTGRGTGPHTHIEKIMNGYNYDPTGKSGVILNSRGQIVSKVDASQVMTVPKNGVLTGEVTKTATSNPGVVSESEIWNAVLARTAGNTNSRTDQVRNLVFSATDVTGSLGVFGITQLNNTGVRKGA